MHLQHSQLFNADAKLWLEQELEHETEEIEEKKKRQRKKEIAERQKRSKKPQQPTASALH